MHLISRRSIISTLLLNALTIGKVAGQARLHQTPKPLSPDAITHDWKSFLGPLHNATSTETPLNRNIPPPLVWELAKGSGYASPAISGNRLVFIDRSVDKEIVKCLDSETGSSQWEIHYPTAYEDRYGYNNGPRSSPIIDSGLVYTMGAEGKLHCIELESGKIIWKLNLGDEYRVLHNFFGIGSTPLVEGELLIINVGVPGGPSVVGLNRLTGQEVWRVNNKWGPSYSSPVPALIYGQRRVFVFAGGESNPPTGGLMSINPINGQVDFVFPWRSRTYESVNASCPVVFNNKVFISASYNTGGALLEIQPDFTFKLLWTTKEFGLHFNTAIHRKGYIYGFDGRNMGDASLVCLNCKNGKVVWREFPQWTEIFKIRGQERRQLMGTARGSLLAADGQFLCLGELGHLLWMDLSSKGYKEVSRGWLFAARESWTLPVLSRGLLYVNQNTRELLQGKGPRLLCYDIRG